MFSDSQVVSVKIVKDLPRFLKMVVRHVLLHFLLTIHGLGVHRRVRQGIRLVSKSVVAIKTTVRLGGSSRCTTRAAFNRILFIGPLIERASKCV